MNNMKKLRKVLALVLAMVMMVAMSVTTFAATTGDITVQGAIKDATYEAYKVFDATYSGTAVSYTIPSGSTIDSVTGFDSVFSTQTNGGKTYVTKKSGVQDTAVISWLKDNAAEVKTACGTTKASVYNSTGAAEITLATGEAGYYFIWSSVGDKTAVTIDTAHPTATVDSKIATQPGGDDDDKTMTVNGQQVKYADIELGTTVDFTISFTATNYKVVGGVATPINQYLVTDTPNGFNINVSSVSVKVNGSDYAISGQSVSKSVSDNGVLTVTIPWDQTTYSNPSTVVVTYQATLVQKTEASNNATVNDFFSHTDKVYNYKVVIDKTAETANGTKLEGAKFVLKNSADKFYVINANGTDVSWVDTKEAATEVTTDAKGAASFEGLAAGTYTLVETQAPEGYNLAADTSITLGDITGEVTDTTTLTVTSNVIDLAGSTLPSTGGMGTTIFYVLGAILVLGAGVVLVSRRRMAK